MIRPYHAKSSITESHVGPAKGILISQQTEPSVQIPNADSPQVACNEPEDGAQPAVLTKLTASPPLSEMPKPEADTNPLPASSCLAAAVAAVPAESSQSEDPNLAQALEQQGPDVSTKSNMATEETIKKEMAISLSQIAGICSDTSHLILSQSDYDQDIALQAINFAAEFASLNGLSLQCSILLLDYSLWDKDRAALVVGSVVREVIDQTGMTMDWAIDCLNSNGWTTKAALERFKRLKVNTKFFFRYSFVCFFLFFFFCADFFQNRD